MINEYSADAVWKFIFDRICNMTFYETFDRLNIQLPSKLVNKPGNWLFQNKESRFIICKLKLQIGCNQKLQNSQHYLKMCHFVENSITHKTFTFLNTFRSSSNIIKTAQKFSIYQEWWGWRSYQISHWKK